MMWRVLADDALRELTWWRGIGDPRIVAAAWIRRASQPDRSLAAILTYLHMDPGARSEVAAQLLEMRTSTDPDMRELAARLEDDIELMRRVQIVPAPPVVRSLGAPEWAA